MKKLVTLTFMLVLFAFTFSFLTCTPTHVIEVKDFTENVLNEGTAYNINFTVSSSDITAVNILLFKANSTTPITIESNYSDFTVGTEKAYSWTPAASLSVGKYKVRIENAADNSQRDETKEVPIIDPTKATIELTWTYSDEYPSHGVYIFVSGTCDIKETSPGSGVWKLDNEVDGQPWGTILGGVQPDNPAGSTPGMAIGETRYIELSQIVASEFVFITDDSWPQPSDGIWVYNIYTSQLNVQTTTAGLYKASYNGPEETGFQITPPSGSK